MSNTNSDSCCDNSTESDSWVKPSQTTCQSDFKSTKLALALVIATLIYNAIEAIIALYLGTDSESILLFGFGLDSIIECSASLAVLYRLYIQARGASMELLERTESLVHKYVGLTFLLLAAFIAIQSSWILWKAMIPEESFWGIILAILSLVIMPLIAWLKFRTARKIKSKALEAEAKETLVCAMLSLTLLIGLLANSIAGWWWADPVAALLMIPWLVREGLAALRGEGCCG